MDAGLDSLSVVEFRSTLQAEFGVKMDTTVLFNYPTINQLVQYMVDQFDGASAVVSSWSDSALSPSVSQNKVDIEIGVYGMSCLFPGGADGPSAYWDMLLAGTDAVTEVPHTRWNPDQFYDPNPGAKGKMYVQEGAFVHGLDMFDAKAFGITPAEAKIMDPQQRMLLEVGYDALHRAGYTKESLVGARVGVFVGAWDSMFGDVISRQGGTESTYAAAGQSTAIVSNRLSFALGLEGPSLTVNTACSSSLVALNIARHSLENGECDVALVAGVNAIVHPEINIQTCQARMLSPTGRCHTFDSSADGYCRGEGCGAIVLKRTSETAVGTDVTALPHPCYGLIRASVVNQDGRSARLTAPNGLAQQAMHTRALKLVSSVGISRSDVRMIETHGTGTALGDPIEIGALNAVYGNDHNRKHDLVLGAVKTNIGHLECAAGVAGLIKLVLCLGYRKCPRNLHFNKLNPEIDFDGLRAILPNETSVDLDIDEGDRMVGGVSSFGFGGTNAHVMIENVQQFC
jgi:acyl transferase domain-containing protein